MMGIYNNDTPKKVYSIDDEIYKTYEEIQEEIYELECPVKDVVVYEGWTNIIRHSDFINVDIVLEGMVDYAYDNHGEWTEGYLYDVTKEQAYELNNLLVRWFNKNIKQPTFYRISNIKETKEKFTEE